MKKILIVDDEEEIFLFLRRIVENKFGLEAVWADNGLKAIKALEKTRFDAVILDVNMPVLDGIETLKIIRRSNEFSELPVLMCSSESDRQKIIEIISLKIMDYILKPIVFEEAINKIGKLFK